MGFTAAPTTDVREHRRGNRSHVDRDDALASETAHDRRIPDSTAERRAEPPEPVRTRWGVGLVLIAIAAGCGAARAQLRPRPTAAIASGHAGTGSTPVAGPVAETDGANHRSKPAWRQFVEADALVFMGGSAAVAGAAYFTTDPSGDPLGFSTTEGGMETKGITIPNWQVAVGVGVVPVLIAATGSEGRWYHAKGAAESLLTTAALTELSKNIFHRHRPRYGPDAHSEDDRKSFFSGHSSLTLAATTYAGLYLHEHVFSRWRGSASVAWWELPAYTALAALSVWVPYTRIEDNMHHKSDVLTGALVGTTLSAAFFVAQERRFRRDHRLPDLVITPLVETPGAVVMVSL
jgi:membrane-associated phospholipid phosphatase